MVVEELFLVFVVQMVLLDEMALVHLDAPELQQQDYMDDRGHFRNIPDHKNGADTVGIDRIQWHWRTLQTVGVGHTRKNHTEAALSGDSTLAEENRTRFVAAVPPVVVVVVAAAAAAAAACRLASQVQGMTSTSWTDAETREDG